MPGEDFAVTGNLIDVHSRRIYGARVDVHGGRIASITETGQRHDTHLLPGFVDAHIHIESSMLVPSEFARLAVTHGTVATVSDPHEIANVLGLAGVEFMLDNAAAVPFKFFFGAPSCVPATAHETSGAALTADDLAPLLARPDIRYLAEMMNYPGVLGRDAGVLAKLALAKSLNKPIDGHAPGLRGVNAREYFATGITTDHECTTLAEALDKLASSPALKIQIREGSAARNFEALHALLRSHPERVMFCSDDKHPDELEFGHINAVAQRAMELGHEVFDVLRAACVNPVVHYGLPVGLLRPGDPADFIEVPDLENLRPLRTWIGGRVVADRGKSLIDAPRAAAPNVFRASRKSADDFAVPSAGRVLNVIEATDGQLITRRLAVPALIEHGRAVADVGRDVLKIAVVNRYADAPPAVAFIKGFGLTRGAIASSVSHDSHNIVAVGADDESLARAVNRVIDAKGGLAAVDGAEEQVLPLPVAGLMSTDDGRTVARAYSRITAAARSLGSPLAAPYMTLSFMALLVIPALKLSDRGLFDGERFGFVSVCTDEGDVTPTR